MATDGDNGLTYEPPPQQVSHGKDCEGSSSDCLNVRVDLTEAGLAALNRRIEVVEGNFCSLESTALEELGDVKETLDHLIDEHKDRLTNLELKLTEDVSALHGKVEALRQQLEAAKLVGGTSHVTVRETKVEVPKLKEFRGERNAQDVENFIWKMEDYFEHLNIFDEAAKIRAATMYLADTAILWWRRKKAEMEKAERQVRNVDEAIAVAESLNDFSLEATKAKDTKGKTTKPSGARGHRDKGKQATATGRDFKGESNSASHWCDRYNERKNANGPRNGYYLCKDPSHGYKDCPSLGKLGALIVAERRQAEGGTPADAQVGDAVQQRPSVAHLGNMMLGAVLAKEPSLKQVSREKPDLAQMSHTLLGVVMSKDPRLREKGSLFVDAKLNGQSIRIMVGIDATHNFVTEAKAKSLGLVFGPISSMLKIVNADLTNVNGVARNVQLNLGAWQGSVSFFVAPMDVFDLVLGLDYWDEIMAFISPSLNQIYIWDPRGPCVVPTVRVPQVVSQLSAIQIVKGFKMGEATFLVVVAEIKEDRVDETLTPCMQQVLDANKDIMPEDLPKRHARPSKAPFGAPVLFQKKQDGTLRYQVRIAEGGKPKTTCVTRYRDFEWLARWQDFLTEFDYSLEYKSGKANVVADALSRKAVLVPIISTASSNILDAIKQGMQHDPVTKQLLDLASQGKTKKFWVEDGLLYTTGRRISVPKWGNLRRIDQRRARHPGQKRTLALLESSYYWPHIRDDIEVYIRTRLVCQQDRVEHKVSGGLLEPLPVEEKPWDSVTMDFIACLPNSEGFGIIMVVVDHFSKYATFTATTANCKAKETARLFLRDVVKHWGITKYIISDCDPRFTGAFWRELFSLLGSELHFSTSFYPQTDGQTERVNALLELYLRHFVSANQKDYAKLLDTAHFSFNLQHSESTGRSPFELATGQQPNTP
ncbi:uncharacterized protein LOC142167942 [Nicotiana tabacum]|uniref:Uncharacterized protein LOC142167942 n=1 Tax=Nicotiana tabacum TaxID=4097 RepID=A0AC58SI29_TOBAC